MLLKKLYINAYNGRWHFEVSNEADIGIKFCPMCGRKLPRPQERE